MGYGTFTPDPDKENTANFAIADKPYNWERIPLIMFRANEFEQPLIDKVKSLQDALNRLLSNFQDNSGRRYPQHNFDFAEL